MAGHLRELPVRNQRFDLLVRESEDVLCRLLERFLLILADVFPGALGKAVDEDGALALAEQDDRAKALRLTLAGPAIRCFTTPPPRSASI
jgi:hypothetical protein